MNDEVTPGRRRRRSGALVATAMGVVALLGAAAGLTGPNPTKNRPVTLVQVPPPPEASGDADAAAADPPAPVDGVATAAEAPTTTSTVAGAKAAGTRPKSIGASTTTTAPTGTVEQRGAAALALIRYPWERTAYAIVFTGPNDGLLGLTEPSRKRITIYIRPTQSTRDIARVLGHEIGHSVDFTMTTDAERADYRRIRGLDDRAWYPNCNGCSDYASPVGDWAETFAYWMLGDGSFASQLAPKPTAAQLTALTPIFTADAPAVTTSTTQPPTPPTKTTAPRPVTPKATTAPRSTAPRSTTPRATTTTTTRRGTTTTTTPRATTTTTTSRATTTTTTSRATTTTTAPTATTTTSTTTRSGTGTTSPSPGQTQR
ncbi:MAG TPA: hypothetical protein VGR20_09300 [Acidimicrobiia bacterium]|nr:hypothetical protein [Acidimicrobiia bacterium]